MRLLGKKNSYGAAMGRVFIGLGLSSLLLTGSALFFAQLREVTPPLFLAILFFGGLGSGLAVWGAILYRQAEEEEPSVALVRRYFTALQGQDYAAALACLHPSMHATGGAPLTLADFARFQAALDAAQGEIAHFAIVNHSMLANGFFSVRMVRASYTVQVTRGAQTSPMYPYVEREGEGWTIRRFTPSHVSFGH
jgi:hypothetical protein